MKKVTQQDIADSLGVSRITVSKALNGSPGIADKMRRMVADKARELGYMFACQLEPGRANTGEAGFPDGPRRVISLLTYRNYAADSYWAPVISGMVSVLADRGYDLSFCFLNLHNNCDFSYPNNFDASSTRGIIILGSFTPSHIGKIRELGLPIVSIDTDSTYESAGLTSDTIIGTNRQPVDQLTAHLIRHGHRDICYVDTGSAALSFLERYEGYRRAMDRAGFAARKHSVSGGDEGIPKLFGELADDFPTAFVCGNDEAAIGLLLALEARGCRIPEDISVCGFDNLNEAVVAGLTTVNVPKYELGCRTAEEILWRIANPNRPCEMVRIESAPIFRKTTGPAPKRDKR